MDRKLTEHQVNEIRVVSDESEGWRVFIGSDEGDQYVDFAEKKLAIDYAMKLVRILGVSLSVDQYVALRCGPAAAQRVLEACRAKDALISENA
jgi:hypothetical protein